MNAPTSLQKTNSRESLATIKLKKLDTKIKLIDEMIMESLNDYQKSEMRVIYRLTLINLKKPKDWKHRTKIMESKNNISSSWTKIQNNLVKELYKCLQDMEDIYKKFLQTDMSSDKLINKYRLYYI